MPDKIAVRLIQAIAGLPLFDWKRESNRATNLLKEIDKDFKLNFGTNSTRS